VECEGPTKAEATVEPEARTKAKAAVEPEGPTKAPAKATSAKVSSAKVRSAKTSSTANGGRTQRRASRGDHRRDQTNRYFAHHGAHSIF